MTAKFIGAAALIPDDGETYCVVQEREWFGLQAELAALRADAERYRFIKREFRRLDILGLCISLPTQLDARIDAALEAARKEAP